MKRINLKDFVLHFCFGRNAEEAAEAVGIDRFKAKTEGLKLLSRKSVINKIKSEDLNKQPCDGAVIAGLERLWEYNENIRGRGEAKALVEALCKDDEKEVFISDSPQGDDEE